MAVVKEVTETFDARLDVTSVEILKQMERVMGHRGDDVRRVVAITNSSDGIKDLALSK